MLLTRWLRDRMTGPAARRSPPARPSCWLRPELLEDRCVPAAGLVDWADVGDYGGQPVGDSLNPGFPSTIDVIDFTLHDDEVGDVHASEPSLVFDLTNRTIDVVFVPRAEPIVYGGFYVQGVWGRLWSLDEGVWTLNGPDSSITFTVGPEYPSKVSITDVAVVEGDAGSTGAVFTVSLSAASDQTVTVDFATADGTATAGSNDYVPTSGTLTFAPGETTKTVTVPVNGDTRDEYDETFVLNLSHPTNVNIIDYHGQGTILDDDPPPALTVNDVTRAEGDSGTTSFAFTVSLSAASDKMVGVNLAAADGTATMAGNDYAAYSGFLTLWPGQTSWVVTVRVNGDTRDESDETFVLNLSNPTNATLAASQGVGTIPDDDPPPSVTVSDVTRAEGNSGVSPFAFTVSLSAASDQSVTVDFATADGTAAAGSDYTAASGTVTFAPGETGKTVTVSVNGDRLGEPNETFSVNLSSPANATIVDGNGAGTIADDEPRISVNDVTRVEGNSGWTTFVFAVSLSAAYDVPVTVHFATADGTARASDNDYVATSGTLTFAPGETTRTITVQVKGDKKKEANETFFLNLGGAVNADLADGQGMGVILNDD